MTTRRITQEEADQWQREIAPQAFTQLIQPTTVSFSRKVGDKLDQFGSGVLLEIADKCFIVSAAHVLDRAGFHGERLCVARSPEPAQPLWLDGSGYLVSDIPAGRQKKDANLRDHDPFDVGACLLPPDVASVLKERFRFLRLFEIDKTVPLLPAAYMTAGYPSALVDVQNGGHRLMPTPFFAVTTGCDSLPEGVSHVVPESIFLSFPRDGLDQHHNDIIAPRLGGISGGGIWRLADPGRLTSQWEVGDVRLVGIETSCRYGHYIRGLSIEIILSLIRSEWPDLTSSIELAHGEIKFRLGGMRS